MATTYQPDTAEQVCDLLATILTGAAGGTKARWRKLVGGIEKVPHWRFVRHNWLVEPSGTAEERACILKAVEVVRAEHPYIA